MGAIEKDRVAVAGDWHCNARWASDRIWAVAQDGIDAILHVGDFGLFSDVHGAAYLAAVESACSANGVTIVVTAGNHEDHELIDALPIEDRGDGWGEIAWASEHVGVLPRGHRFDIVGANGLPRSFVSLGGAPSIDKNLRRPGVSWWPQEAISPADVERTAAGGHADYMLVHDTPEPPTDAVIAILRRKVPTSLGLDVQAYADEGRRLLTAAFRAVRPTVLFHGHYHVRDTGVVEAGRAEGRFACRIESLDQDGGSENVVVLDVATGHVSRLALG